MQDSSRSSNSQLRRYIIAVIVASAAVHAGSLILNNTLLIDWRFEHLPFHSVLEASGAFIAIFVSYLLLASERRGEGTSFNIPIAGALLGMGILDAFHAAVHPGNLFVWLHSLATFIGGLLFSCILMPQSLFKRLDYRWPIMATISSLTVGTYSIILPESIPLMIVDGSFTSTALILNIIGGALLIICAVKLALQFKLCGTNDDLLFVLHSSMFGFAAIMFQQSSLWDAAWWGWHVLRFIAYGVAFWFALNSELIAQLFLRTKLDSLEDDNRRSDAQNQELELAVKRRTIELESAHNDLAVQYDQLKIAKSEIDKKADELARSNHQLDEFAYIASHDLKSPLRGIDQVASWIADDVKQGKYDELDENLGFLRSRVMRMEKLLNDLLEYSRVRRNGEMVQAVDINELITDLFLLQSPPATFTLSIIDTLPTIVIDEAAFEQVARNLISNAIKHHNRNDGVISISYEDYGSYHRFIFSDDGPGIEPQYHELIFRMFKSLRSRDDVEGSGMGLALIKKIMEANFGSITLDSDGSNGSRFVIDWPKSEHIELDE